MPELSLDLSSPFAEQRDFFLQKLRLPTATWLDLWQSQHDHAFVVAGVMRDDLLSDFQGAIAKALDQGLSLDDFRKDFDRLVQTYGWSYKGGRGWRSNVIFETNVLTSYNAGRYRQMTDPDVLKRRPYWRYVHGDSARPRPLHLSWHGTVLPYDDPWWNTHFTPNGWGCKCTIQTLSERELEALGKTGPDTAPDDGTYEWKNPKTGVVETVPVGIDPGWAYHPGKEWVDPRTGRSGGNRS